MSTATLEENKNGTRVFIATITRKHIEEGDFDPVFKLLNHCGILQPDEADPANLENMQFKICLLVDGYKDEASELVEVPEVCRYFQKLHAAWPYGLYFFNPQLETLQLLVWCNAGAMLARDEDGEITGVRVPADKLKQFIYSAMTHFFLIAGQLGWAPEKVTGQITRIAGLFETTATACPPASAETLKQRHLAYIKERQGDVCRAFKLSLNQVDKIKKAYNLQNPKSPWENPADWVASQGGVLSQNLVAAKAGAAPVWFLIQALYTGGDRLAGILPFCGDGEEPVTTTLTRRQWFQEVSKLVLDKGTLRDAIEKQWGEIIKVTVTKDGTTDELQAPSYGAFLLHRLNLRFIPEEDSFYKYFPEGHASEKEGTWEYLTVTEVQREIMEWVVKRELSRVNLQLKQIGEAMSYMRPLGLFSQLANGVEHRQEAFPLAVMNLPHQCLECGRDFQVAVGASQLLLHQTTESLPLICQVFLLLLP